MLYIEKMKAAAIAVKENGGCDSAVLFTDLTMPDPVLEPIARLEAAEEENERVWVHNSALQAQHMDLLEVRSQLAEAKADAEKNNSRLAFITETTWRVVEHLLEWRLHRALGFPSGSWAFFITHPRKAIWRFLPQATAGDCQT